MQVFKATINFLLYLHLHQQLALCNAMKKLVYYLIRLYQLAISPFIGPRCRYLPTCSDYALEAFEVHGIRRGGYLTFLRLLRCNPWGGSGFDPVPAGKLPVASCQLPEIEEIDKKKE